MVVYLVMVEQHYAGHVRADSIFSTLEKAEAYKKKRGLGNDLVIYEVTVDEEGGII